MWIGTALLGENGTGPAVEAVVVLGFECVPHPSPGICEQGGDRLHHSVGAALDEAATRGEEGQGDPRNKDAGHVAVAAFALGGGAAPLDPPSVVCTDRRPIDAPRTQLDVGGACVEWKGAGVADHGDGARGRLAVQGTWVTGRKGERQGECEAHHNLCLKGQTSGRGTG